MGKSKGKGAANLRRINFASKQERKMGIYIDSLHKDGLCFGNFHMKSRYSAYTLKEMSEQELKKQYTPDLEPTIFIKNYEAN